MPLSAEARRHRRALSAAPEDYIWCRTFGHSWDAWHSDRTPEFGYYESVYCGRCGTERHFTISGLGTVISRRYVYPEDYSLGFKLSRVEARREMRKRGWWDESARTASAAANARPAKRPAKKAPARKAKRPARPARRLVAVS